MKHTSFNGANIRLRNHFSKPKRLIEVPNLIQLQRESYEKFLQKNVDFDKRSLEGLEAVFRSVFPIEDFNKTATLEFISYNLELPKYDVEECRQRGMTYASPLKITLRLVVFDVDEENETKNIRDVREQEVYFGEIPLMTDNGSFVINGTERVVVSQLHRSPGVFFDHDSGKGSTTGKIIYSARLIPYRGSWLDFEFDQKDLLYARIDRKRKFPVTILLKAIGLSVEDILEYFYPVDRVYKKKGGFYRSLDIERIQGQKALSDIVNPKTKEVLVKLGRRITRATVRKVQEAKIKEIPVTKSDLIGRIVTKPIVNSKTGEVILDTNEELTQVHIGAIEASGIKEFRVIFFDGILVGPFLRNTLLMDKVNSTEGAKLEIYKRLRPGEPPTEESVNYFFNQLFFSPATYDLSEVGRLKINHAFGISFETCPVDHRVLTSEDIKLVVKRLINLKSQSGPKDDIDHLGNRRVRSVGELVENQYRIGLVRIERSIRERMMLQDLETAMPHDLINAKPVNSVVKEFFNSSQLSQFMDQVNPLAEITHKRRLSALGPGGLSRERAGFEVRDVHPTHYGRICPIETPEGPNIGLISSLATYARINQYGFIETPYRKVKDCKVEDDYVYLSALEEKGHIIAPAGSEEQLSVQSTITCRGDGEYITANKEAVTLMDVSPSQLVSIATSLIPFLEHDDASRALMGSNMQKQAVSLLKPAAPLIGTGVEQLVARDSGTSVVARNDGVVQSVDASQIVVRRHVQKGALGANLDIYHLMKYKRTNQNTCFNQKPIVKKGDKIKKGEIISDGPSTELGELALGQNVTVAFMPWMGYNFEDSILLSERLIKDDVYTSIHIEEFECLARDTKLGKEEITRDIANLGEGALRNLDSSGIITIGSDVGHGDILVGKVTPKGETQVSPEEKLLRAIFGEKAGNFRDTSLRVPSSVRGTVIGVNLYSREIDKDDERLQEVLREKLDKIEKDYEIEQRVIKTLAVDQIKQLLVGKKTKGVLLSEDGEEKLLEKDQVMKEENLESIPFGLIGYIPLEESLETKVQKIAEDANNKLEAIRLVFEDKKKTFEKGDELPPGVIKVVKVYLAIKRKLQVGDKLAGRHGNKGVVSRVLPVEDMPYMENGKPVDMVLNPLGVPSRMNIGQVLEIHLGWAAYNLGKQLQSLLDDFNRTKTEEALWSCFTDEKMKGVIKNANDDSIKRMIKQASSGLHIATPVFEGAREEEIKSFLKKANLKTTGQAKLYDGRTGEVFDKDVTVGTMYILKLHHLVEEKIHARSIGPYSLVSQQPLGGKAQFGGQRLGEMEVWAIEAYGAAYSLQELLTVKSDDVSGRTRLYESIVKGEHILEPGLPESFNVLIKELQSLAIDIELEQSDEFDDEVETVGLDGEVVKGIQ